MSWKIKFAKCCEKELRFAGRSICNVVGTVPKGVIIETQYYNIMSFIGRYLLTVSLNGLAPCAIMQNDSPLGSVTEKGM